MASTSVSINRGFDEAWAGLQRMETWRGVAGIDEMSDPVHSAAGDLEAFNFSIDTPVGRVRDQARVTTSRTGQNGQLSIDVDQKGVRVRITVEVAGAGDRTVGNVEVGASATSFLTKPLAATLGAALSSSIEREAALIVGRLEA